MTNKKNERKAITTTLKDRHWWITVSYCFAVGALLLALIEYIRIVILEFGIYYDPVYTMEEKLISALHSFGIGKNIAVDLTMMFPLICAALFVSVYLVFYQKHYKKMPSKFTLALWILLLLLVIPGYPICNLIYSAAIDMENVELINQLKPIIINYGDNYLFFFWLPATMAVIFSAFVSNIIDFIKLVKMPERSVSAVRSEMVPLPN